MRKVLLIITMFAIGMMTKAGEITEQQALQKAQQFMKGKHFKKNALSRAHQREVLSKGYYIFNVEDNSGFIIVAGDDRMPDILGYAENGNLDFSKAPDNVKWLMDYYAKIAQSLKGTNGTSSMRRTPAERSELTPLVKTTWNQGNPYNLHCPMIGEDYTLTGCVATAMAQVINYSQWPLDEVRETAGNPNLPARKFNWFSMTDDDIAWLMRYCGQAVQMKYDIVESSAMPANIPYALTSIFKYSKNVKIVGREEYADEEWEELIYNELNLGRPVIYSGFQGFTGHTFVVHGYRDGLFTVNWGWGGDCDGYFALTNLAPNEYTSFNENQNAVIGIQPSSGDDISIEEIEGTRTIHVAVAGTLPNLISDAEKYQIRKLTLTGEINGTDIRLIRDMAGKDSDGNETDGKLQDLDLSGTRIVEGGDPYANGSMTSNDVIGSEMFYNCKIYSLSLPNTVTSIERYAFGSYLMNIIIPKSVIQIEDWAFHSCENLTSIIIAEDNPIYYTMGKKNGVIERATGRLVAGSRMMTIPEGVKSIGKGALVFGYECGSFKLPESLETIEQNAFGLTIETIFIPKNVSSIHPQAFSGCDAYSISIDANNPVYDSRNNCNAVIETATNTLVAGGGSSIIPNDITKIGERAFADSYGLTVIDIPSNINAIGNYAFDNCYRLSTVSVHYQDPIEIDENVFSNLRKNVVLVVPDGTIEKYKAATGWNVFPKIVEASTFSQGHILNVASAGSLPNLISEEEKNSIPKLTLKGELNGNDLNFLREMAINGKLRILDISDVNIVAGGDSYVSEDNCLGYNVFWGCYKLEEIILPKTLTSIGESAFADCKIKSIVIPKSVVELGREIFYKTPLASISVEEGNPVFDSRGNCNAVIETATNTLRIGCPNTVIPNSVTSIGDYAFSGKPGQTSVTIPDGTTSIGSGAFWSDYSLTSIHISKSVVNFGESPFGGCGKISTFTVDPDNPKYDSRDNCNALIETATNTLIQGFSTSTIPNGIMSIGPSAFQSQDFLTSIEIPASVTSISEAAFMYCNSLTTIVSHIKKPHPINSTVFNGDNLAIATLYVPYGTKKAYASTSGWNVFSKIVEMEPDDSYLSNSASVAAPDFSRQYAAKNGEALVPISITGEGIEPVTSIDYTITTGDIATTHHLELEEPITYMMTAEVLVPFTADETIGEHAKTFTITKVNGVVNECTENTSATGTLVTVAKKPKIVPVVEEYTGTWCGWCPRGAVGLNLLSKTFRNDVVTIAVHSGDAMALSDYPVNSGSFPSCQINRGETIDPYYGSSDKTFGIKKEVESVQRGYSLGGIEMEAAWNDDTQTAIDITTTTTFVEDLSESPYQIGFVLLEDGMTGSGSGWIQSNYYAGNNTTDKNLQSITVMPSKITDMKFDHVPVGVWQHETGIEGSLPSSITHDVPLEYTYTIDISGNTRIQNKNKLTVVALLLDKETGKIANAAKYRLKSTLLGDVNCDENVNAQDIVDIVNYMMGKATSTEEFDEKAADLNNDNVINIADIIILSNMLFGAK